MGLQRVQINEKRGCHNLVFAHAGSAGGGCIMQESLAGRGKSR